MTFNPIKLRRARDLLEHALSSPNGILVEFANRAAAVNFRRYLYTARVRDRQQAAEAYPPDHELHGVSPYDALEITIRPKDASRDQNGPWFLKIAELSSATMPQTIQEIKP